MISRMEHRLSLPRVLGAEGLQEMQEEARDIRKVLERPRKTGGRKEKLQGGRKEKLQGAQDQGRGRDHNEGEDMVQ